MRFETNDGYIYNIDEHLVVHQVYTTPFDYDDSYINNYNNPQYKENSRVLNHIRLSFLAGAIGRKPNSILDVGCGNGDFLRVSQEHGIISSGYDVASTEIEGITKIKNISDNVGREVVCFWDSLEHVENLDNYINKDICPVYVAISLPCLPAYPNEKGFISLFENWKHRKPNEHLHHFTSYSLDRWFASKGYKLLSIANIEDVVRKSDVNNPNIITAVFLREDSYF